MKEQQIYNMQLAYEVLDYIMDNPDLRFIQALWALGIVDGNDRFYESSEKTLQKLKLRKKIETEKPKGE